MDSKIERQIVLIRAISAAGVLAAVVGCDNSPQIDLSRTHSQSGMSGTDIYYKTCYLCHGEKQIVGPTLKGVFGAAATHDPNYSAKYSEPLKKAAPTLVWNRANLIAFITDPQSTIPGANMPNPGLDREAADLLVDYLESKHMR